MLIVELDGLDEAKGFVDAPPNTEVINGCVSYDALFVDHKCSPMPIGVSLSPNLNATEPSADNTPNCSANDFLISDSNGKSRGPPRPPCCLARRLHARWAYSESTEQAKASVPILANWGR